MTRYIRSENSHVSVAQARTPDFSVIPPFFYSGSPTEGADSGLWYPPGEIVVTSAWASARVTGAGATTLTVQYGDNIFNTDGVSCVVLQIPAGQKRVGVNVSTNGLTPLKIATTNWIRVVCTTAGGHEDIAVQINAEYVYTG
jgi:hypothetical protein